MLKIIMPRIDKGEESWRVFESRVCIRRHKLLAADY